MHTLQEENFGLDAGAILRILGAALGVLFGESGSSVGLFVVAGRGFG